MRTWPASVCVGVALYLTLLMVPLTWAQEQAPAAPEGAGVPQGDGGGRAAAPPCAPGREGRAGGGPPT